VAHGGRKVADHADFGVAGQAQVGLDLDAARAVAFGAGRFAQHAAQRRGGNARGPHHAAALDAVAGGRRAVCAAA
jgi:hypothetical protein